MSRPKYNNSPTLDQRFPFWPNTNETKFVTATSENSSLFRRHDCFSRSFSAHGSDTIFEYSVSGDSLTAVNTYATAGSGSTQIRHIAIHPTTGKVYASSAGNSGPNNAQVYEWDPSDPSAAAVKVVDDRANLQGAAGLAFDEFGNLYVGESFGSGEAGLGDASTKTAEIYKYTPNNSGTFDYDSVFATLEDTHVYNNGDATFMQYIGATCPAPPAPTEFEWNQNDLGNWTENSNWNPRTVPNQLNHSALFRGGISGPTTVVTNIPVTVNHIDFDNAEHTYNIAGLGSINLAATTEDPPRNPTIDVISGNHQFQATVNLVDNTTANVASDSGLTFINELNLGGQTLTKTGMGTLSIRNDFITGGGTLTIVEGEVSGNGTVGGDLTNAGGTIAPGNSPGVLTVSGNLNNTSGGTIAIEIEGTDGAGESQGHDQIQVTGSSTLDGTLSITTGAYADPTARAARDTFTLIASAGGRTGTFGTVSYDEAVLSADFTGTDGSFRDHIANGLFRNVNYDGNDVSLTNLFALEGDADGDIDIDITDFNILASNFDDTGANSATNDWTTADFDADGDIDITDFNFLAANFADTGYGGGESGQVPEPTTWMLLIFGIAGGCLLLRRRVI